MNGNGVFWNTQKRAQTRRRFRTRTHGPAAEVAAAALQRAPGLFRASGRRAVHPADRLAACRRPRADRLSPVIFWFTKTVLAAIPAPRRAFPSPQPPHYSRCPCTPPMGAPRPLLVPPLTVPACSCCRPRATGTAALFAGCSCVSPFTSTTCGIATTASSACGPALLRLLALRRPHGPGAGLPPPRSFRHAHTTSSFALPPRPPSRQRPVRPPAHPSPARDAARAARPRWCAPGGGVFSRRVIGHPGIRTVCADSSRRPRAQPAPPAER
jgi:hypothetical protein